MKPISEVKLLDCMEGMRQYPDKYFELAIVDPPYGIGIANMDIGLGKSKKASKAKNRKWGASSWDKKTPNSDYFNELRRVSKGQIIWGGNYFELGPCKNYVIWDKEIPMGLSFADCEMAWTSFCGAPKMFRHSAYLDKATAPIIPAFKLSRNSGLLPEHHPTTPVKVIKSITHKRQKDYFATIAKRAKERLAA